VTVPATGVLPVVVARVKVVVVRVDEFIGTLKVAVRAFPVFTLVALLAGTVAVTVGTGGAPVVKVHTSGAASAISAELLTPVVIVAVYVAL
jgi:hypothetical protein